jgi:PPM family protein phosphatase
MKFSSITDVGLVRKRNEDSKYVNEELNLFVVADGMGGHRAGQIASSMAINILEDYIHTKGTLQSSPSSTLKQGFLQANAEIFKTAKEEQELSGMGTTLTAGTIVGRHMVIAHVGDSRGYLIRDGQISRITDDHSLVFELMKNGGITPEEAERHPQKNILVRAVGTHTDIEVDLFYKTVHVGDLILLTSDGLTNLVKDEEILEILLGQESLDHLGKQLLQMALDRGGNDNVTIVLVHVDE